MITLAVFSEREPFTANLPGLRWLGRP